MFGYNKKSVRDSNPLELKPESSIMSDNALEIKPDSSNVLEQSEDKQTEWTIQQSLDHIVVLLNRQYKYNRYSLKSQMLEMVRSPNMNNEQIVLMVVLLIQYQFEDAVRYSVMQILKKHDVYEHYDEFLNENMAFHDQQQFFEVQQNVENLRILINQIVQADYLSLFDKVTKSVRAQVIMELFTKDKEMYQFKNSKFIDILFKNHVFKQSYHLHKNDKVMFNYRQQYKEIKEQTITNIDKKKVLFGQNKQPRMIQFLIENKYQYILAAFYLFYNVLSIDLEIIIKMHRNRLYHFLNIYLDEKRAILNESLRNKHFFNLIQESNDPKDIIQMIFYFHKGMEKDKLQLPSSWISSLISYFRKLHEDDHKMNSIYINNIQMYCIVSQILKKLQHSNVMYDQLENLSQQYLENAFTLIEKVSDDVDLQFFLFHNCQYFKISLIDFMFSNHVHFQIILNLEKVQRSILNQWKGNSKYSYNMIQGSIQSNYLVKNQDIKINKVYQFILNKIKCDLKVGSNVKISKVDESKSKNEVSSFVISQDQSKLINGQDKNEEEVNLEEVDVDVDRTDKKGNRQQGFKQLQHHKISINIFKYLYYKQNINKQSNNFNQFQIFKKDLSIKAAFDILIISILTYISLRQAFYYSHITTQVIHEWNNPYYQLYQNNNSTLIQSTYSITTLNNNQAQNETLSRLKAQFDTKYCDFQTNDYYRFSNSTQKASYYSFCKNLQEYKEKIRSNYYYMNLNLLILIFQSLEMFAEPIYQYLVIKTIFFNATYLINTGLLAISCYFYFVNYQTLSDFDILQFHNSMKISFAMIQVFQFIKLVHMIRIFKFIGIYIQALKHILIKISYFLVLFLSFIYISAVISKFHFQDLNSNISNVQQAFLVMLDFQYGNIDINKPETPHESNYNTFQVCFAFFVSIILVNIVIAILSAEYTKIQSSSQREYSSILYFSYLQNYPDDYFSCMLFYNLIFTPIALILFPFLYYSRKYRIRIVNKIFLVLAYIIRMYFIFIITRLTINCALIVPCYLKILYNIFVGNYKNRYHQKVRVKLHIRIIHFLLFLMFGILYLVYITIVIDQIEIFNQAVTQPNKVQIYLVNYSIYKYFKMTVYHFKTEAQELVDKGVFIDQLVDIIKSNTGENEQGDEKFQNLIEQLRNILTDKVHIEQLLSHIRHMKIKRNCQYRLDEIVHKKMRLIQMIIKNPHRKSSIIEDD